MSYVQGYDSGVVSQLLNRESKPFSEPVQSFFYSTNHIAESIINSKNSDSIGHVKTRRFYFWSPYPFFYSPMQYEPMHRDSKEGLWMIGLLALAVLGFAVFKIGQAVGNYREANTEISEVKKFKASHLTELTEEAAASQFSHLEKIIHLRQNIFTRIKNNALCNIIFMTSLAASSAITMAGAVLSSAPLLGGGILAGLATSGILLYRWGFNSTDGDQLRDAKMIRSELVASIT